MGCLLGGYGVLMGWFCWKKCRNTHGEKGVKIRGSAEIMRESAERMGLEC